MSLIGKLNNYLQGIFYNRLYTKKWIPHILFKDPIEINYAISPKN